MDDTSAPSRRRPWIRCSFSLPPATSWRDALAYRFANFTFCGPDDRILFSDWTDEGPRLVLWRWTDRGRICPRLERDPGHRLFSGWYGRVRRADPGSDGTDGHPRTRERRVPRPRPRRGILWQDRADMARRSAASGANDSDARVRQRRSELGWRRLPVREGDPHGRHHGQRVHRLVIRRLGHRDRVRIRRVARQPTGLDRRSRLRR